MNAEQLAGFFSAHAVWSVSDGGPLIPMYAVVGADGKPEMQRLAYAQLEDGVAAGRTLLENEQGRDRVLIFDGRIPLGDDKHDALIVEWRSATPVKRHLTLAIPYTPAEAGGNFLVHRPKILDADEQSRLALNDLFEHFWEGVDQHTEGAKVWNDHLDQSK